MVTVIKIKKNFKSPLEIAVKYFGILAVLNNFKWTEKETHVLAYIAVKGSLSSGGAKKAFIDWYKDCSKSYLEQVLFFLKKEGYLVKEGNKVILNPAFRKEITEDFIIQLNMHSDS